MTRTFIRLCIPVLLCFLSVPLHAQQKLPNTLLWKIQGKGLKKPSYLYGTMHVGTDKAFHFMDSTLIDFDKAELYAMELNTDSIDMMSMLGEIMIPGGKSLQGMLSGTDYNTLDSIMKKKMGYSAMLFNNIKPLYVVMMLEMPQDEMESMKGVVVDTYFDELAKKQGKPRYGLERMDDQMKLLHDIPMDRQVRMLSQYIHEAGKSSATGADSTSDSYARQDLNKIYEESQQDTSFGADFTSKFINKRNVNMANAMEKLMQKGTVFTAVGAAHLPGDSGIINLLKLRGYQVSPVLSKKYLTPQVVKARLKDKGEAKEEKKPAAATKPKPKPKVKAKSK